MSNRRNITCTCKTVKVCHCRETIPVKSCHCQTKQRCCCKCATSNPPELGGIQAQLDVATDVYLDDGQTVIFDKILRCTTRDISYNPVKGIFCLRKRGTYLINWDVAVEGSYHRPFVRFSLLANDIVIGSSTLPVTVGQLSGTSLFTEKDAPMEL